MIGDQCHWISNRLDIVPRAWVRDGLRSIADLYHPVLPSMPGLGSLANDLAAIMQEQELAYTHIGNTVQELPGSIDTGKPEFVGKVAHQHLQVYLGIADHVSVDTFFAPLR